MFSSFEPFNFNAGEISSSRLWLYRPIQVDAALYDRPIIGTVAPGSGAIQVITSRQSCAAALARPLIRATPKLKNCGSTAKVRGPKQNRISGLNV